MKTKNPSLAAKFVDQMQQAGLTANTNPTIAKPLPSQNFDADNLPMLTVKSEQLAIQSPLPLPTNKPIDP